MFILGLLLASTAIAQRDARLWLRFPLVASQPQLPPATIAVVGDSSLTPADRAVVAQAEGELRRHWSGNPVMLQVQAVPTATADDDGVAADDESFSVEKSPQGSVRILSPSARGLLYGVYFILRSQTMGDGCLCATLGADERLEQRPAAPQRLLWLADDLTAIARRGQLADFARATASLGFNGVVLLGHQRMGKRLLALADSVQPYGLRLLLPADVAVPAAAPRPVAFLGASYLDRWQWYLAGRRTWDPAIAPELAAFEWLSQTFTENPLFVLPMRDSLLAPAADPAALEQQLQEAAQRY